MLGKNSSFESNHLPLLTFLSFPPTFFKMNNILKSYLHTALSLKQVVIYNKSSHLHLGSSLFYHCLIQCSNGIGQFTQCPVSRNNFSPLNLTCQYLFIYSYTCISYWFEYYKISKYLNLLILLQRWDDYIIFHFFYQCENLLFPFVFNRYKPESHPNHFLIISSP